jgi:hypothetical protein
VRDHLIRADIRDPEWRSLPGIEPLLEFLRDHAFCDNGLAKPYFIGNQHAALLVFE